MYSNNEKKVYFNRKLEILQNTEIIILEDEYNEVLQLFNLFAFGESSEKKELLNKKMERYRDIYLPKINELKRIANNTKSRFKYNMNRC